MTGRRVCGLIACVVVFVIACIGVYFDEGKPSFLTWTEKKIHAKIDNKLGEDGYTIPHELLKQKHVNLLGVKDINVKAATVDLSGGDIAIDVFFAVTEFKTVYIIHAHGKGDVEFVDDAKGSFYFRPAPGPDGLKLVSVEAADETIAKKVGRVVDLLSKSKTLQRLGVADDLQAAKDMIKEKAEGFVQKYAALAAETAFKKVPVYRFKDDNIGWTAHHSYVGYEVKDVVEDGQTVKAVVAKVSFWKLTGTVIAYFLIGVAAVIVGIVVVFVLGGAAVIL